MVVFLVLAVLVALLLLLLVFVDVIGVVLVLVVVVVVVLLLLLLPPPPPLLPPPLLWLLLLTMDPGSVVSQAHEDKSVKCNSPSSLIQVKDTQITKICLWNNHTKLMSLKSETTHDPLERDPAPSGLHSYRSSNIIGKGLESKCTCSIRFLFCATRSRRRCCGRGFSPRCAISCSMWYSTSDSLVLMWLCISADTSVIFVTARCMWATCGCRSTSASSVNFLAVGPRRSGLPLTNTSPTRPSSFCAMDSTATFRVQVTRTRLPRGTRAIMMW